MTVHSHTPPPPIPPPSSLHHRHGLRCLVLFLLAFSATAQFPAAPPPPPADPFARLKFDKNMAIIMVILVLVFFILGFLSIYTRQCAERRMRGRLDLTLPIGISSRRPRGLEPEIIDSFPTFVYSSVKGLKMGRTSLECAVCLNEFEDDETLRLIPRCSHVFHPDCIDLWLSSHSTCPLCRANLVPKPGDSSFVAIQIPNPDVDSPHPDSGLNSREMPQENINTAAPESPILSRNHTVNRSRTPRSKSTGFWLAGLFPRSHSTGHSLQLRPGENWERFTLRLPEDARRQLLKRTNSCVAFTRESSQRRGYRTRSVGSGRGRNYFQHERFGGEGRPEQWGFTVRPPFLSRSGSTVTNKAPEGPSGVGIDDIVERSSDPLFSGNKD
ncbi:RING-H2 finger protein ATL11-like [Neltuma alba]|uniref:RING-H2 finger protein ATL11-like n=1 Tax=Neltuma alba TaxID=207710 RepID=UPI0010A46FB4|nr:RING-H2 finger protein ATL11-like [Prosopis alba]